MRSGRAGPMTMMQNGSSGRRADTAVEIALRSDGRDTKIRIHRSSAGPPTWRRPTPVPTTPPRAPRADRVRARTPLSRVSSSALNVARLLAGVGNGVPAWKDVPRRPRVEAATVNVAAAVPGRHGGVDGQCHLPVTARKVSLNFYFYDRKYWRLTVRVHDLISPDPRAG